MLAHDYISFASMPSSHTLSQLLSHLLLRFQEGAALLAGCQTSMMRLYKLHSCRSQQFSLQRACMRGHCCPAQLCPAQDLGSTTAHICMLLKQCMQPGPNLLQRRSPSYFISPDCL